MAYTKRTDGKRHTLKQGEFVRSSDGKYCYKYKNPVTGKYQIIYANTLEELREKEEELKEKLKNGIDITGAKLKTLNDFFYAGMELRQREGTLKPQTRLNYENLWRDHIKSFGEAKAADITVMHVRNIVADLNMKCLARSTIKLLCILMSQSFDDAISNNIRIDNPMHDKAVKKARSNAGTTKKVEALTAEEQERLMIFVRNTPTYSVYADMLTIVLLTGMRVGEFTGLRWKDVDLEKDTIRVDHQLKYGKRHRDDKTHFYIETPKTEAGKRTIYIVPEVRKAFKNIREINFMFGKHCAVEIDGYTDFIFMTKNGTPYATNAINFILDNIVKAHNRENPDNPLPHISAHVLRHCYGTRAVERGMDYKELQRSMGHADISVTMNVYAKPNSEEWQRKEQEKISKAM